MVLPIRAFWGLRQEQGKWRRPIGVGFQTDFQGEFDRPRVNAYLRILSEIQAGTNPAPSDLRDIAESAPGHSPDSIVFCGELYDRTFRGC